MPPTPLIGSPVTAAFACPAPAMVVASESPPAAVSVPATFAPAPVETAPAAAAAPVHANVSIASLALPLFRVLRARRPAPPIPRQTVRAGRIHGDRRIHPNLKGCRRLRARAGVRQRREARARGAIRDRGGGRADHAVTVAITGVAGGFAVNLHRVDVPQRRIDRQRPGNARRVRRHGCESGRRIIRRAARPVGVALLRPRLRRALHRRGTVSRDRRAETLGDDGLPLVGPSARPIDELSELAIRRAGRSGLGPAFGAPVRAV